MLTITPRLLHSLGKLVSLWAIHTSQPLVFLDSVTTYLRLALNLWSFCMVCLCVSATISGIRMAAYQYELFLPRTQKWATAPLWSSIMFWSMICFPRPGLVLIVLGLQPRFPVSCVCVFYHNKVNVILKCSSCFASSERLSTMERFSFLSLKSWRSRAEGFPVSGSRRVHRERLAMPHWWVGRWQRHLNKLHTWLKWNETTRLHRLHQAQSGDFWKVGVAEEVRASPPSTHPLGRFVWKCLRLFLSSYVEMLALTLTYFMCRILQL